MPISPETARHLETIEAPIRTAKEILTVHGYPDSLRTVIVAGLIDQLIENHGAIVLLIRSEKIGSAFALARSVFEGTYRGLWLNLSATDQEITDYEQDDRIPLNFTQIAEALDRDYRANGFFIDLKDRGWAAMNSYAHTGMLQLGRRFTGHELRPAYTDDEIKEVTTTITTCSLMLVGKFLAVRGFDDDCRTVEALIGTYGPAAGR